MPRPQLSSPVADQNKSNRLAIGMLFFVIALLMMGGAFWLLWFVAGPTDDMALSRSVPTQQMGPEARPNQSAEESEDEFPEPIPARQEPAKALTVKEEAPPLQGPEAGQLVAPPSRNVTPNYQLSPMHQAQPLQRVTGKTLPPPPDLPPLPQIFRRVTVEGPGTLLLKTKFHSIEVTLASVAPPESAKMCWHLGQKAPCATLGKLALTRFIRGRAVGCLGLDKNQQRSKDAAPNIKQCFLGVGLKDRLHGGTDAKVTDLAGWMVEFGWVTPNGDRYSAEHQQAQRLKRGLYALQPTANEQFVYDQLKKDSAELAREIEETAAGLTPDIEAQGDEDQALSLFSEGAQEPDQIAPPPPVIQ